MCEDCGPDLRRVIVIEASGMSPDEEFQLIAGQQALGHTAMAVHRF